MHEQKLLVNLSTEEAQVELSIAGMLITTHTFSASQHAHDENVKLPLACCVRWLL